MRKRKLSTNKIVLLLVFPDFIMVGIWAKLKESFPDTPYVYMIDGLVTFLFFLILGGFGLICAIRKEMPQGGVMLKGRPAVILGSILAVVSWFFALFALYRIFFVM